MRYEDPPDTEGSDIRALVEAVDRLRRETGHRHVENTTSLQVVEADLKVLIGRVDDLAKGFPGNDPDGHRRAHEAMIARAEARARLYDELRAELAKKGLWALLIALGTAVWFWTKTKVFN
ncbi:hypothetical protein [Burkholderia gladioli]|uniref:hypothetical protein n=1 Tax=Burkholderia gladioli TaxID=28095 RepID=UPI00163E8A48|nr:hypothetical protein [Burkholderia gladioli]